MYRYYTIVPVEEGFGASYPVTLLISLSFENSELEGQNRSSDPHSPPPSTLGPALLLSSQGQSVNTFSLLPVITSTVAWNDSDSMQKNGRGCIPT